MKRELLERAKELGITGVSHMTKEELAHSIERRQQYLTQKERREESRSRR